MLPSPPPTSTHIITLPTNESLTYHLRSLNDSSLDIQKWTAFCSSVFSYKDNPPPPSYFARHFYNDPRRDAALVRVLVQDEGEDEAIVSSVRIFRRTLTLGPGSDVDVASLEAGGIGEVCTSPNHQRRGLSKILLSDALKIMKHAGSGMSCSLLHASPDFRPVYAKVGGYECVTSCWSVVPVLLDQLTQERSGQYQYNGEEFSWKVRQAVFPQDTPQLYRLHQKYSEERLVTIQRSEQYWNDYVRGELGDNLWVLTTIQGSRYKEDSSEIVAWISIRKRGGRYQLREFGFDKSESATLTIGQAMKHLLGVTIHQIGEHIGESADNGIGLHLPTIVLSDIQEDCNANSCLDLSNAIEENDDGWMYVNFDERKPGVLELTRRNFGKIGHLIWPTDSF
eukprot:CCRYP_020902-RA/>CCRYP_020902-RA protein AED:0.00 eAED:0.00 QI:199/-1/1/1/-1/1/1/125/394